MWQLLDLLRTCHTVFQSVSTVFRSHQQCMRFQFLCLLVYIYSIFLIFAIPLGLQRYLIVVLLRDSLMAEDGELSERALCAMCKARGWGVEP